MPKKPPPVTNAELSELVRRAEDLSIEACAFSGRMFTSLNEDLDAPLEAIRVFSRVQRHLSELVLNLVAKAINIDDARLLRERITRERDGT